MTLKRYYDALMKFDWDFSYRSDPVARAAQRDRYAELTDIAKQSPKHLKMFEDFVAYNTLLIRNPKLKPVRPK